MELTLDVNDSVAEKLRLVAKLDGATSQDLKEMLSKSIDRQLSFYLIDLTKNMLSQVGVSPDMIGAAPTSSEDYKETDIRIHTEPKYNVTERLGEDVDAFDAINATSAGNLLEDEEDTMENQEDDEEVLDLSAEEAIDELDEDFSQEEKEEESWQESLLTDIPEDYDFSAQDPSGAIVSEMDDEMDTDEINSGDPLPSSFGIKNVSIEGGSTKGSADFMMALMLEGSSSETKGMY